MTEPWNCWPNGDCPSTAANMAIGLGIAAALFAFSVILLAWWMR